MTPRHESKIRFDTFGAINQAEARRIARRPGLAMCVRVYFAAMGRANRIGHAEFGKDELAAMLHLRGEDPGRTPAPSRQQVWAAVRRAKELELIEDSSTIRCLVLPAELWDKGNGSSTCYAHGLRWR